MLFHTRISACSALFTASLLLLVLVAPVAFGSDALHLSRSAVDFGEVGVEVTARQGIHCRNDGNTTMVLILPFDDEYEYNYDEVTAKATFPYDEDVAVLNPGEQIHLSLHLTPHRLGLLSTSIAIEVEVGSDSSTVSIAMTSTGVTSFIRGDANGDGVVDLNDGTFIINYHFNGGPAPLCWEAADANDDGRRTLDDAIYVIQSTMGNVPPPAAPFPHCGTDPDPDSSLGCERGCGQ